MFRQNFTGLPILPLFPGSPGMPWKSKQERAVLKNEKKQKTTTRESCNRGRENKDERDGKIPFRMHIKTAPAINWFKLNPLSYEVRAGRLSHPKYERHMENNGLSNICGAFHEESRVNKDFLNRGVWQRCTRGRNLFLADSSFFLSPHKVPCKLRLWFFFFLPLPPPKKATWNLFSFLKTVPAKFRAISLTDWLAGWLQRSWLQTVPYADATLWSMS